MPGLVRKLVIFAAVDGLVLQPLSNRGPRASAIQISYNDHRISPTQIDVNDTVGLEAFGIVGLLTVSNRSYLISITKRQQVAQIHGKAIYLITEVALTPLSSKSEAERSISERARELQGRASEEQDSDDSDAELSGTVYDSLDSAEDDEVASINDVPKPKAEHRTSTAAEDVLVRKGGYGRFAKKWFSQKGWTVDQRRSLGLSGDDEPISDTGKNSKSEQKAAVSLLPKLLRTTQVLFGTSRSFYFSYDHDLTRNLSQNITTDPEIPLASKVDPLFFWNRNLSAPLLEAGQHSFVLPLLQGFVGQRTFTVDREPSIALTSPSSIELTDIQPEQGEKRQQDFLLTLISRRSVKRAGLRYLRRGIDEEGNAANSVETEQILSEPTWKKKAYSFVQIRGSIPIFFSQTPYSFKPIPQTHQSEDSNYAAFTKHFESLTSRYGALQVASLVEKHGPESIVGAEYEKYMNKLKESGIINKKIGFEWFDFHSVCRGMKFENVSLLMDSLDEPLTDFGYTLSEGDKQIKKQIGVLRTNCMDCLDRTNVVQSACATRSLELQLKEEGFDLAEQLDQTREWFNTMWADNGDAISRQYASSDAMKGDYTRTRKRNFQGALKDVGLSISRFYNGIVNDYFSQAAIDFLLGNATEVIFDDFESDLISSDPGVNLRKMRQQAIEVSHRLVIEDEREEFIGGWTLLTPQETNTLRTLPFQECVLLLTDTALYTCRFDWNLEKVSSFERIDLSHVTELRYGTYITSTLVTSQVDEDRNVGLMITYIASGNNNITRVNTRTVQTDEPKPSPSSFFSLIGARSEDAKFVALKALPSRSAALEGQQAQMTELDQVKHICNEIERVVTATTAIEAGTERPTLTKHEDVISLAEARSKTGLIEKLGHSLKRLVWA